MEDEHYMKQAIEVALEGIETGGGPFGAVIVDKNGVVLAKNHNQVTLYSDNLILLHPSLLSEVYRHVLGYENFLSPYSKILDVSNVKTFVP